MKKRNKKGPENHGVCVVKRESNKFSCSQSNSTTGSDEIWPIYIKSV